MREVLIYGTAVMIISSSLVMLLFHLDVTLAILNAISMFSFFQSKIASGNRYRWSKAILSCYIVIIIIIHDT